MKLKMKQIKLVNGKKKLNEETSMRQKIHIRFPAI